MYLDSETMFFGSVHPHNRCEIKQLVCASSANLSFNLRAFTSMNGDGIADIYICSPFFVETKSIWTIGY